MLLNHLVTQAKLNPKKLFLLDGFGAFLSAFFLGFVLIEFEDFFGIPSATLYLLASIPIFFALFDFYCYLKTNQKIKLRLRIIALLNLMYCLLSCCFAIYHLEIITIWGWIYISTEIAIIIFLAMLQIGVGKN